MTKLDQLQIILRECIEEHRTPAIFDAIAQVLEEMSEKEDDNTYYDPAEGAWYILGRDARRNQRIRWKRMADAIGYQSEQTDPRPTSDVIRMYATELPL